MKKSILYRKIQIETKYDLFDYDDKNYGFNSIESGIVQALHLSRDLKCVTKLVDCAYYEGGDYKRNVIATFNYSSIKNQKVHE